MAQFGTLNTTGVQTRRLFAALDAGLGQMRAGAFAGLGLTRGQYQAALEGWAKSRNLPPGTPLSARDRPRLRSTPQSRRVPEGQVVETRRTYRLLWEREKGSGGTIQRRAIVVARSRGAAIDEFLQQLTSDLPPWAYPKASEVRVTSSRPVRDADFDSPVVMVSPEDGNVRP